MKPLPLEPEPPPIGWAVTTQDFRGRLPGSLWKRPKVSTTWFATKAEALAHQHHQRELNQQPEFVICVAPAVFKQGKPKTIPKPAHKGAMG